MGKFKVKGALRESAEDIEVVIEASSYKEAERAANKMGILVSDVLVAEEPKTETKESERRRTEVDNRPFKPHVPFYNDIFSGGCLKIVGICFGVTFGLIFVFSMIDTSPKRMTSAEREAYKAQRATQQSTKETRPDKIKKLFSVWDGSHRASVELIKEYMHNPDSFEHVHTDRWDEGDHISVITTYRGTNMLGGVVKNTLKTKIDLDGNIIGVGE